MHRFIRQILFFVMVVLLTQLMLWWLLPTDLNHYFAAIIDKNRLLDQAGSPKIVLVGGSNLACGVNTERLQSALHEPVVNMGLHADLGLRYMLEEVRERLQRGDCVVIVPEYEHFFGLLDGNVALVKAVHYYPRSARFIRTPRQWWRFVFYSFDFIQGNLKYWLEEISAVDRDARYEIYQRQGFSSCGDLLSHLDRPDFDWRHGTFQPLRADRYDPRTVQVLAQFGRDMRQRGVQMVMLFPCYEQDRLGLNRSALQVLLKDLQAENVPVLGPPADYAFPRSCFYDTEYHMNRRGREKRTDKMIEDLQRCRRNETPAP
jgi:hypothetical protein